MFVYLVLNLMLYLLNYIHLDVYTSKTRQILSLFASKSDILISRYILENACIAITCISRYYHIKNMTFI